MTDRDPQTVARARALPREDWQWLADQLRAWPVKRVHPERTMCEAALRPMAADVIEAALALLTREAEVRGEERAKVARFIRLYDMWCEGWGMYRNLAAATEAAGEIAAMIDKWDWSVPIPDDDEAAEDHIVRIVQCWYRERNEASIRSDRPAIRSAPSSPAETDIGSPHEYAVPATAPTGEQPVRRGVRETPSSGLFAGTGRHPRTGDRDGAGRVGIGTDHGAGDRSGAPAPIAPSSQGGGD